MTRHKRYDSMLVMASNSHLHRTWLRAGALRLTRIHLLVFLVYAIMVGVFDSSHLMTPDIITQRAILVAIAGVITCGIWYAAHKEQTEPAYYKRLIYGMVLLDVAFAAFSLYTDRGVASRDVALFALPVLSAATLVNRSAIYGAAALSTVGYFIASMRYYYMHPNEMLHVELYGMLAFHSIVFFVAAAMVWVVARARK